MTFQIMSCGVFAIAFCVVAGESAQQGVLTSRTATATRVVKDLARRLHVPPEQIELLKESNETWPDANLGCAGRKPLGEPTATQGFAFTLLHLGRQYVYHSDRRGNFKRCDDTRKPIGPISKNGVRPHLFESSPEINGV